MGQEQSAQRTVFDAAFDEFWKAYPRHVAKPIARRAWTKAVKVADVETIIEGARRYAADPNRAPAFTAHPSTWLNGERWDDDPLPPRIGQPSSPHKRVTTDRTTPSGRTDRSAL